MANLIIILVLAVIAMFIIFRAFVDFQNEPGMTINEWVELNIERIKQIFKKK
jgi:ABC-type polysaccharide transport system permease subunit